MTSFVESIYPRGALVQRGTPEPQQYLVSLVDHLQRCSLPAAARFGPLRAAAVRRGVVAAAVREATRRRAPVERTDFDELLDGVRARWAELAAGARRLPPDAPELSLLCLRRSFGWLVFVFGGRPDPLLVCKLPNGDDSRVRAEVDRLAAVTGFHHAPRHLARVGAAYVQEAMPGQPLHLDPLRPQDAATAEWGGDLDDAAAVLATLGRATAGGELRLPALGQAEDGLLRREVVDAVRAGRARLLAQDVSVVRHRDVGPQNVLATAGRVTGIVDWELSDRGLPGVDLLQLLVSVFEQRLGLVAWDDDVAATAFRAAWGTAPLFVRGRERLRSVVETAGLPAALAQDVEVAFFAERLADRCARPGEFLVGARLATQMLEAVASA